MFKKRVKISNSHQLSNKDKKQLKEQLLKLEYYPDIVEQFFNDKNYQDENEGDDDVKLTMDKLQGARAVLYSRGGQPYLFNPDSKGNVVLPSMYLLF